MERLTRWTDRETAVYNLSGFGAFDVWKALHICVMRLAAYEDTGLEPEEINRIMSEYERGIPTSRMIETMKEPPNEALTLEELRDMDGEPVWVVSQDGRNESCWMLVDVKYELCREAHGGMAVFDTNGKTWLAYRRKPEEV